VSVVVKEVDADTVHSAPSVLGPARPGPSELGDGGICKPAKLLDPVEVN
jgi:hypothetical protein